MSRIDVIGLFLDPEQELMFQSRIDVIGLLVDPGPRQLGWTSTAWLESGTELVSRIDVIGLFLDPEQELMFQSRIDVIGLLLDPGPRQLGWTPTAWLESAWLDSAWLESAWLDSAWLDSGTGTEKLEEKQLVGTSGKWFP